MAGTVIQAQTAIIEKRAYEMLYMRIDLPELQGVDIRNALVGGVNGMASGTDIKIGAIQDVNVDGKPAVWAHGTWKGDEADVTAIYANRRIYVLAVHTEDDSTDVQREFERSFDAGS